MKKYTAIIFTLILISGCVNNITDKPESVKKAEIISPQNGSTIFVGENEISLEIEPVENDNVYSVEFYINNELVQSKSSGKENGFYITVPEKFKGQNVSLYVKITYNSGLIAISSTISGLFINPEGTALLAPGDLEIYEFKAGELYGLKWKLNSKDETGVEIWRKDYTSGGIYNLYKMLPRQFAYNDTIKEKGKVYYYKIRAFRDTVFSAFSNEVNTTLSSSGIPRPTNLRVKNVSQNSVSLEWNDNSTSELGFILERRYTGSVSPHKRYIIGPDMQIFKDSLNIYRGTEYQYQIKAYSATDSSDYSNTVTIRTEY